MCNFTVSLDKRAKVFKDYEAATWMFWSSFVNVEDSEESGVASPLVSINYADDPETLYTAQNLEDSSSYLFMTKSNSRRFNLPLGLDGKLNSNVYYAGYIEEDEIKPIKNCYYPDLYYDRDLNELQLIFWANVAITALTELVSTSEEKSVNVAPLQFGPVGLSAENNTETDPEELLGIYPDFVVNPENEKDFNVEAQRCLFYSTAQLRKSVLTIVEYGAVTTNWFVFSRPILLMCTGRNSGGLSDPVTDQISLKGFAEFKFV